MNAATCVRLAVLSSAFCNFVGSPAPSEEPQSVHFITRDFDPSYGIEISACRAGDCGPVGSQARHTP
jgi:hypothetical protein